MSLGKPRNGLRRGLGHLSYIWWVSRIQIFKFSNVTVTFSRNNGYKTVTFFKNFENVHTCCCHPGAREFMVQADKNFQKFSLKSRKFLSLRDAHINIRRNQAKFQKALISKLERVRTFYSKMNTF